MLSEPQFNIAGKTSALKHLTKFANSCFIVEVPMKAFGIAVVVAVALAIGAAVGLSFFQETVAQAYSTGATRLDQQESVNLYGR